MHTRKGMTKVLLFSQEIIKAEWLADQPNRSGHFTFGLGLCPQPLVGWDAMSASRDGCACDVERVENCSDLYMRPYVRDAEIFKDHAGAGLL